MLILAFFVSIDRVCVEVSLPHEVVFRLDCVACREGCETERRHLHVQSVSFWAPANIGPYSQAVSVSILAWLSYVIESSHFIFEDVLSIVDLVFVLVVVVVVKVSSLPCTMDHLVTLHFLQH